MDGGHAWQDRSEEAGEGTTNTPNLGLRRGFPGSFGDAGRPPGSAPAHSRPPNTAETSVLTLAYRSDAVQLLPFSEITDICLQSAHRNQERGITGFLVEYEGTFMQILEGAAGPVTDLYASIIRDRRHHGIKTLMMTRHDGPPRHGFWAMNYGPLNTESFWRAVLDEPMDPALFRERSHEPDFALEVLGRAYEQACNRAKLSPAVRHLIRAAIPQPCDLPRLA
nr:BLUF domain-containing protein [Azospirillum sp. SYSU D00513]